MVTWVMIHTKDYIEVSAGEIYEAIAYVYNFDIDTGIGLFLKYYDKDLVYISDFSTIVSSYTGTGAWKKLSGHAQIPDNAAYARIYITAQDSGTGAYMFLDNVSLKQLNIANIAVQNSELIAIVNETTKHTVVGEEFDTGIWKEAEYYLDLTKLQRVAAGANVTIDVKIESYDPETDTWRDAMVFQQLATIVDAAVSTTETKTLVGNLGWKQRISYTTAGAGTIEDCDFKVGVVYKR